MEEAAAQGAGGQNNPAHEAKRENADGDETKGGEHEEFEPVGGVGSDDFTGKIILAEDPDRPIGEIAEYPFNADGLRLGGGLTGLVRGQQGEAAFDREVGRREVFDIPAQRGEQPAAGGVGVGGIRGEPGTAHAVNQSAALHIKRGAASGDSRKLRRVERGRVQGGIGVDLLVEAHGAVGFQHPGDLQIERAQAGAEDALG